MQSPLRMMTAHGQVTTPYKRIRVETFSDADIAYPLIANYLTNPDLAESVEEFVISLDSRAPLYDLYDLYDPSADRLPFSVSESDHAAILEHVDSLGLSVETTSRMKLSLDWWRQTALARPSRPAPDRSAYMCTRGTSNEGDKKAYDEYAATAAALLLSLCPNISTLHLGEIHSEYLEEYLRKSNYGLTPKPALQSLQHVVHYPYNLGVRFDCYDTIMPLRIMQFFHRLPRILSVSMEAVAEQDDIDIFPPRTSGGIKKLHYGHVDMSTKILATAVRVPTALEEFSLSNGGLIPTDGATPWIHPGLLGRALDQHEETLKVVDIDLGDSHWMWPTGHEDEEEEYEDEFGDAWDPREDFKDEYFFMDEAIGEGPLLPTKLGKPKDHEGTTMVFRNYTALTHLSVSIPAIVGQGEYVPDDRDTRKLKVNLVEPPPFRLIDALPPSLEYLCIYGYIKGEAPEVDELVAELMEKRHERLPKLAEVKGVDNYESSLDMKEDEDGGYSWRRPYEKLNWVTASDA